MKFKHLKRYIFIGIILFSISVEVYLRTNYSKELAIGEVKENIFQDDSVILYTYRPNTTFEVTGKKNYINNNGYIGPEIQPKSNKIFRIVIVGACGVAGSVHQAEYHSFCPLLEDLLKTNYSVEVINCGIDGDNRSWELFKSIEYKVLAFEPDMILLEYGLPFYSQHAGRREYRGYKFNYSKHDEKWQIKGCRMIYQYHKKDTENFLCRSL